MADALDWVIMGRAVGTASGWDQVDNWQMLLFDFVPAAGVQLPRGDVNFNFEDGLATLYSNSGTIIETVDIVDAISHLPQTSL